MASTASITVVVISTIYLSGSLLSLVSGYSNSDFNGYCNIVKSKDGYDPFVTASIQLLDKLASDTPNTSEFYLCTYETFGICTQHGVAGCIINASVEDCTDCLVAAKNFLLSTCSNMIGGRTVENGNRCYMRYENYWNVCNP
ncbi:hypothetical protein LINGRAHAP2_LOCUS8436 [Linum grandiflorum]